MPTVSDLRAAAIRDLRKAVRHAPLGPVARLPKQGGSIGRAAVATRARHLVKVGRAEDALRLIGDRPDESLPSSIAVARADPVDQSSSARLTRGERQHLEVVRALLGDDPGRADDLRREHLAEFPGDLLVVWLGRA